MNWILPYPSAGFWPAAFRQSAALSALSAKADKWVAQWMADAEALLYTTNLARCPSIWLPELGWLLQAGITAADTDVLMRQKIASAQASHSTRGTLQYDAGPKIQAITGIFPTLFAELIWDWWVLCGGNPYPVISYWAILGGNNDANMTGMIFAGSINDGINGLVVFVNLGSSTLTGAQIAAIVAAITVPCYMRVFLGYVVGAAFISYAGGQIN